MKKLIKNVLALVFALALCLALVSPDAFAATNYLHRWNDDKPGNYFYGNSDPSNGNFSLSWSTITGTVMEGKGWKPYDPTNITIGYNIGAYSINGSSGGSYLAFYGWVNSPQFIECRIIESWQNWRPNYTWKTTITVDNASYDVYTNHVYNAPSINGATDFIQYWSVRRSKAPIGSNCKITVRDHVASWRNYGFPSNANWAYGSFSVEGYQSSGNCNVTVWKYN